MAYTTGAINVRIQPRWLGDCNIVATLPTGAEIFVFPDRKYAAFTQCVYLDDDDELMIGWAPTEYVEIK
jgi:hypothetical protein